MVFNLVVSVTVVVIVVIDFNTERGWNLCQPNFGRNTPMVNKPTNN